jgi:hypothetical protein
MAAMPETPDKTTSKAIIALNTPTDNLGISKPPSSPAASGRMGKVKHNI